MEPRCLIPVVAGLTIYAAINTLNGEISVIRPGPCQAQDSYLLARNSAAVIQVDQFGTGGSENHIIVFRYQPRRGWASQRLLKRFDLKLQHDGPSIVNSGGFCSEER